MIKMYKYLPLIIILLSSFSSFAEDSSNDASEEEMKPQIGSIEDFGRVDPDVFEFSNTENKLWMDKHLLNIDQPARLHYEFEKTGSYEDGFVDDVYLDIVKINEDNTRNTLLDFFSSEKKQKVAPSNVMNITGNPVIGIYLQGDVYEMNRLTDGHWKYFLREIKLAMADSNESESIAIEFNGEHYQGEKIILNPFNNAKNKERLKEFSDKRYEFILSDTIPGKLYQIKTVINDAENPDIPLMEEILTLKSIEYSDKVVGK
jgi:hypothetical protein